MEQPQPQQIAVLVLKIVPILFPVIYSAVGLGMYDRWDDVWGSYKSEVGYSTGGDEEWRYHELSVFLYDKVSFKSSLIYSFFLAAVLHGVLIIQTGLWLMLLPLFGYFALGILSGRITNRFFKVREDGRNPDTYENYYYDNGDVDSTVERAYRGLLPKSVDRRLSPGVTSLAVDFLILVNVLVLEAILVFELEFIAQFGSVQSIAIGSSALVILLVVILLILLFPVRLIWSVS